MKFNTSFTFESVRHDKNNDVHLVVSLQAPKKDWEKERAPICVFPVIDISGSMHGQKLDYAKKSAIKLVEHLQDSDYAGLAVFEDGVELVSEPVKMTVENKNKLRQKIGDLFTRGCTNFSGGLLMGLEQLNKADLPENLLLRVIMLTDGHANRGVATRHNELTKLLADNLGRATVSCFGYGEGADQELLSDLARLGKGNYAFIENPDDALSAFAKELGGLLSTYAQNIEISVESNNGHEITEVVSDVDADGDDKKVLVKLPEILSEEKSDIVIAVKLSKQSKALPRALNAFNVKISYDFLGKDGKSEKKHKSLKAKMKFVKSGKEQEKPTAEVDRIVALAQMVKTQIEAEKMADKGNYHEAQVYLQGLATNFTSRNLPGQYAEIMTKTSGMLGSADSYLRSTSYRTSTKSLGRRRVGTSSVNAEAAADMGFIGDADTGTQKTIKESFTDNRTASDIKIVPAVITTSNQVTLTPPVIQDPDFFVPSEPDNAKVKSESKEKKTISKSRSKRW